VPWAEREQQIAKLEEEIDRLQRIGTGSVRGRYNHGRFFINGGDRP
jgi:hypothetical protein